MGNNAIGADHRLHPEWAHYEAPREIVKILEKTHSYGEGGYRTFEKWVEICHLTLDGLPNLVHHAARGVPLFIGGKEIKEFPQ